MHMNGRWVWFAAVAGLVATAGCGADNRRSAVAGDPAHGKVAIARYGCPLCHTIPGIEGATAVVGPPLDHVATRPMLGGGHIPNTPENMIKWIQHPQQIDPKNVMPELGVTDPDAKDIAAYLETLK